MVCPDSTPKLGNTGSNADSPAPYTLGWVSASSYIPNAAAFGYWSDSIPTYVGRRITRIRNSSQIVVFQEGFYIYGASYPRPKPSGIQQYNGWTNPYPNGSGTLPYNEYTACHPTAGKKYGGNLSFADGHGEYRPLADLHASDFGLTGGAGVSGLSTDTPLTTGVTQATSYLSVFDQ
jgi:prepilin-type processing-associated H-X9-DG protein